VSTWNLSLDLIEIYWKPFYSFYLPIWRRSDFYEQKRRFQNWKWMEIFL